MAEALRVGIAGLGTVGGSVARVLSHKASELTRQCGRPIVVTAVSARDASRDRGVDLSSAQWFVDPVKLAENADIDVFVELIGGDEGPARASVKAALDATKADVTFGSQIRSYVFQPYTMVNDHRTELKIPDVQRVMDGDIDPFVEAYLKQVNEGSARE